MVEKTEKNQPEPRFASAEDADLALYFAAARSSETHPRDALMDRILQDAENVQSNLTRPDKPQSGDAGFVSKLLDNLGGWRGISTLTACATMGVLVGFSAPDSIAIWSMGLIPSDGSGDLSFFETFGADGYVTEQG